MSIPFSCARFVTGVCYQESLKHIERLITARGVVTEASETNSLLIMAVQIQDLWSGYSPDAGGRETH